MFFQLSQWMKEKHKTATDESYRDLANLNEKLKKHEAFELELKANNARLNQLNGVCCSFRNTFKFIFSENVIESISMDFVQRLLICLSTTAFDI